MMTIMMKDFLSDHRSTEDLVKIQVEPDQVFFEEGREINLLNFEFVIEGLTDKELSIRFIKAAAYDGSGDLLTFRHVNHNAVGMPGIHTTGKWTVKGKERFTLYNPFFQFPKNLPISSLRYMFTFRDAASGEEHYLGDIVVHPHFFQQEVKLKVPLHGLSTILDGHDYYSHHRRFDMEIVRRLTGGKFSSNFSRYGLDFTLIGPDGNLNNLEPEAYSRHYDFHFDDVRTFYSHGVPIFAPAGGIVVDLADHLEDLYDTPFDMGAAIAEDKIKDLAGNYVIIQHNRSEFSHLFHLLKGSIRPRVGEQVKCGQEIGKVGFSGASTTYSHLHYQLMDGMDFLTANSLPCKFSDVTLVYGRQKVFYPDAVLDTGDFIYAEGV